MNAPRTFITGSGPGGKFHAPGRLTASIRIAL